MIDIHVDRREPSDRSTEQMRVEEATDRRHIQKSSPLVHADVHGWLCAYGLYIASMGSHVGLLTNAVATRT